MALLLSSNDYRAFNMHWRQNTATDTHFRLNRKQKYGGNSKNEFAATDFLFDFLYIMGSISTLNGPSPLKNATSGTLRPPVQKLGGRWPPLPIPSNFFFRTPDDAAKIFHARLITFELPGRRDYAKNAKSEKWNFFSNFEANLNELQNKLLERNLTRCRGQNALPKGREHIRIWRKKFPLEGVKLGTFHSPITPNRK